MKFPDVYSAISTAKDWLSKNGSTTLHFIKGAVTEQDGYLELAISDLPEHQIDLSTPSDKIEFIDLEVALTSIEQKFDKSAADKINLLISEGLIPSDKIFTLRDDQWTFASATRVALIFISRDWDSLSEYHAQYMKPTRH